MSCLRFSFPSINLLTSSTSAISVIQISVYPSLATTFGPTVKSFPIESIPKSLDCTSESEVTEASHVLITFFVRFILFERVSSVLERMLLTGDFCQSVNVETNEHRVSFILYYHHHGLLCLSFILLNSLLLKWHIPYRF